MCAQICHSAGFDFTLPFRLRLRLLTAQISFIALRLLTALISLTGLRLRLRLRLKLFATQPAFV